MEQEPKTPRERAEDLIRLLVPEWRPTPQQVVWAIRVGIVMGLLVAIGYPYGITLWDWAKLLIVPAVIAAGGVWFNQQQRARDMEVAEQHAQDEALQAYLDQMSKMLTDKDRPLRGSREAQNEDLSTVARARTLTVLSRLDATRKRRGILFVYEADLINKDRFVVDLKGADLSGCYLRRANLSKANLSRVDLSKADLSRAYLFGANLFRTNLFGANLRDATLREVNLGRANLSRSDLSKADLSRANLYRTDLFCANLRDANLRDADLRGAYLKDATVSQDQLIMCKSLQGATMPNGQKLS